MSEASEDQGSPNTRRLREECSWNSLLARDAAAGSFPAGLHAAAVPERAPSQPESPSWFLQSLKIYNQDPNSLFPVGENLKISPPSSIYHSRDPIPEVSPSAGELAVTWRVLTAPMINSYLRRDRAGHTDPSDLLAHLQFMSDACKQEADRLRGELSQEEEQLAEEGKQQQPAPSSKPYEPDPVLVKGVVAWIRNPCGNDDFRKLMVSGFEDRYCSIKLDSMIPAKRAVAEALRAEYAASADTVYRSADMNAVNIINRLLRHCYKKRLDRHWPIGWLLAPESPGRKWFYQLIEYESQRREDQRRECAESRYPLKK